MHMDIKLVPMMTRCIRRVQGFITGQMTVKNQISNRSIMDLAVIVGSETTKVKTDVGSHR